jgi:hypothetical protein
MASQAFGPHAISQTPPSHALVQSSGHSPTGGGSAPQITSPVSAAPAVVSDSVLASPVPSEVDDVVPPSPVEPSCEPPVVVVDALAVPEPLLEPASSATPFVELA